MGVKVRSRVSKHGKSGRLIVEVPLSVRDNFKPRESVTIEKSNGGEKE